MTELAQDGRKTPGIVPLLARWRQRLSVSPGWTVFAAVLAGVMALPLATIVWLSFNPRESVWPHLMRTVLPGALADTALLLAGVGALTLLFGTGTAWLTTMYRFPGRGLLDRLLVLPLAMPTYIIAYTYVELLDFSGPVQRALRALFGWHTVKDYWFPEVRTLPGAILVLSAVLYPYVYLSARASFVQQSICVLEVARTLGRTSAGAFWSVALPLARPALAAGVALALMECMNDLGAVQYLGVSTLTVSIYVTWLQRSSLAGAAQIALVALLFVLALLVAERAARGKSQFHHTTGRYRSIPFSDLEGWRGYAAAALLRPAGAAGLRCALRGPPRAGPGAPVRRLRRRLLAGDAQQRRRRRGGGRRDRPHRPGFGLREPAGAEPCSCAPWCGRQASATPCRGRCWRSAC